MELTVYKYFELCYDLLPFPVEVFNEKGFVVYVNNAFSKKWGYSLSELNGYSYSTDTELAKRNITQKIDDVFKNKNTYHLRTILTQDCSVEKRLHLSLEHYYFSGRI